MLREPEHPSPGAHHDLTVSAFRPLGLISSKSRSHCPSRLVYFLWYSTKDSRNLPTHLLHGECLNSSSGSSLPRFSTTEAAGYLRELTKTGTYLSN